MSDELPKRCPMPGKNPCSKEKCAWWYPNPLRDGECVIITLARFTIKLAKGTED